MLWRYIRCAWVLGKSHLKPAPCLCYRFYDEVASSATDLSFEHQALRDYLEAMKTEHAELEKQQMLTKMYRDRLQELKPVISLMEKINKLQADMKELDVLKQDFANKDQGLKNEISEEHTMYAAEINVLQSQILDLLVPPEYIDNKDIVLEISAGVGGKEAMLFTMDLFHMYCKYAKWKNWKYEILEYNESELDGLRSGSISISGGDVGRFLKFEGGVHRVQRVPKTEKHGRIHTSTTTVAILPQPSEIEITLEPKDLIIETKRSSGAGGQHVNTTDSCVRITHIPTGIAIERQTERHQHLNKEKALKALRTTLYQKQIKETEIKQRSNRKLQVGTGARSEKVRTYNFVQDRITDHRIGESIFGMDVFLGGQQKLDKLILTLLEASRLERLWEVLAK